VVVEPIEEDRRDRPRRPSSRQTSHAPEHAVRASRLLLGLLIPVLLLAGCGGGSASKPKLTLSLVSGSENQTLEPILQRFAKDEGVAIDVTYLGSVDIMLQLQKGAPGYDAVWPASSLWITLGDKQRVVKNAQSILRSPVVLGVKRSVAERLGWVGKDVTVEEILAAAEAGKLRYMMTSATQSNSGAMAYFGYLYAFAGRPEVLTTDTLQDPAVREKITRILGTIDRSAGSSGWLKDLFLQRYDGYDAMVNYESLVIEADQQLVKEGKEPLYAVYPVDGLAIADSPLGYVDHGDAKKAELFQKLQTYLLSADVQKEILGFGRRVGLVGLNPKEVDPKVFNPDWGIDVGRVIDPITLPSADVIQEALDLYQTAFRKPSFTVFCLDFSGSMEGKGEEDLKTAMRLLLDQNQAAESLLQAAPGDVTVVIPFDDTLINEWTVRGNDPAALADLLAKVTAQQTGGKTNIYAPVIRALDLMQQAGIEGYSPAVILMTDGQSNQGSFADLQRRLAASTLGEVPVYAILFGDASTDQLTQIANATSGRIFDGRTDLVTAFRTAKGYN
jgi:Ca-activated chloride channel homolog